jgi:hypothetical protein
MKENTLERNTCIISEHLSLSERCCPKKNNLRMVTVNTASHLHLTISGWRKLRQRTITFSEQRDRQTDRQTAWSSTFHQLAVKTQSDIHVVSVLSSGIFSLYFYY